MAGSDSEALIDVEARAPGGDVAALARALNAAGGKLMAAGATPAHMLEMSWSVRDPAALHPARRDVDRVRREAFAGFRPPLRIAAHDGDEIIVRIRARRAGPSSPEAVFRGLSVAALAGQMSPRNQIPDMSAVFAKWTAEGAAARARFTGLDIAYGPERDQTLDLYRPPGGARPPLWVFIHGGYWQGSCKEQHAQFCTGMMEAGFAVANIDYGLAPETPLARIVEHVRAALCFLAREADNLGVDAGRMHVCGHSAGGHLAAYAACDPHAPPLLSAHPLSGVLDLEPLLHLPMGAILRIGDRADVERLSPVHMKPRPGVRIAVAVGGDESDEFIRQSAALAQVWDLPAPLVASGANHFTLPEGLAGGPLLDQALALCG